MQDYSVSGDFGQVKFYNTSLPSGRFKSTGKILCMGWHCVNPLYSISRPNGLDTNLLLLTRRGKGDIAISGKEFNALPGTAIILPRSTPHSYRAAQGCEWEFYWLHYNGGHTQAYTEDILTAAYSANIGVQAMDAYIKAFEDRNWQDNEKELMESQWLDGILFAILRTALNALPEHSENAVITEMISYMENNLQSSFSLSKLAKEYHYTKEYLIKLFKDSTGNTPYSYWRRLRLKQSCRDLLLKDKSIGQIACEYGYASISSYTNQFKKLFGISPSEYKSIYSGAIQP